MATALQAASAAPEPADVVIRGGTVHDGSAGAPYIGDVAIKGDRIVYVGTGAPMTAARTIDASGMIVTLTCYCPQWPAVAQGALCPPPAAPPYGWRQRTLCKVAAVELLAHRLMYLVSALSRRRWAPHDGLRRCAAAPGLVLGLVVIELVLVALHETDMDAKITLALVATPRLHGTKPGTSGYAVATRTPKRKGLLLFS